MPTSITPLPELPKIATTALIEGPQGSEYRTVSRNYAPGCAMFTETDIRNAFDAGRSSIAAPSDERTEFLTKMCREAQDIAAQRGWALNAIFYACDTLDAAKAEARDGLLGKTKEPASPVAASGVVPGDLSRLADWWDGVAYANTDPSLLGDGHRAARRACASDLRAKLAAPGTSVAAAPVVQTVAVSAAGQRVFPDDYPWNAMGGDQHIGPSTSAPARGAEGE